MKISEPLSKGIRVVSFCAFVCVVMIHSKAMPKTVDNTAQYIIYTCLFSKLTSWAVPWFFLISGYFVKLSLARIETLVDLIAFVKRKFVSLVVPYILWSLIITFLVMPIVLVANYRMGRTILCNTPFDRGILSWNAFLDFWNYQRRWSKDGWSPVVFTNANHYYCDMSFAFSY